MTNNINMYQFSAPVFVRHFEILQDLLKKAETNATERKIDQSVFINARLAPDMLPLSKQIQIASDVSKGCIARLAGVEIPSFADTETSFSELQERIAKTIAFIKSIPADKINGSESRDVVVKMQGQDKTFNALEYLQTFAVPNFYFHIMIAYALCRANGVPIGKMDFLGELKAA